MPSHELIRQLPVAGWYANWVLLACDLFDASAMLCLYPCEQCC